MSLFCLKYNNSNLNLSIVYTAIKMFSSWFCSYVILPQCSYYAAACLYCQACRSSLGIVEQVRGYYVDWRMLRDVKRRQMAYEYADTRLRINAIRKNTLLPKELQVIIWFNWHFFRLLNSVLVCRWNEAHITHFIFSSHQQYIFQ